MNLKEIVTYLWLNQAFLSLIYPWVRNNDLLSLIRNGNISYEFVRPINFFKKWFATLYASRLSNVLLRFLPVVIISCLLPYPYKLGMPASVNSFILFIIALALASLIITAINMIIHLITFYTIDEKGIICFCMVITEIFAGGVVPIAFFPGLLKTVANILPFRFTCDLPFRIYSGNINIEKSLPLLLFGIIWLIILIIIGHVLSKNISKKVIIQGG